MVVASRFASPTLLQDHNVKTELEGNAQSSPIEWLSDDLLTLIIVERVSIWKEASFFEDLFISHSHPLITASHVSRRWRQLLLASPSLWSEVSIATPTWDGESGVAQQGLIRTMQQLPEIARTWIERSQNCTLSINLRIYQSDFLSSSKTPRVVQEAAWPCYMSLVDLICDVAGRWSDLNLDIYLDEPKLDQATALDRLYNLRSDDVPLLEELNAGLQVGRHIFHVPPVEDGVQMGASLRSLSIPTTACRWEDYGANWSRLTELHVRGFFFSGRDNSIEDFGAREALALLRACPNLVICHLSLASRSCLEEESGPTTPVTMALLEVLDIRGPCPWPWLSDCLVVPSLRDLTLFLQGVDGKTLKRLFGRFGEGLRSVQLEMPLNLSSHDVDYILDQVPNLTSLIIPNVSGEILPGEETPQMDVGTVLFSALTVRRTPQGDLEERCRCRELKQILVAQEITVSDAILLDFVQSRRNIDLVKHGVAMIEFVTSFSDEDEPRSDLKPELLRRGVDITGLYLATE